MENLIAKSTDDRIKDNVVKNRNKITPLVKNYVDRNNEILFDIGPVRRLLFLETDKDALFDLANIDRKEIDDLVKNSEYIDKKWKISSNSFNVLCALCIRQLELNKCKKEVELMITYLTLAMYSPVHFKYFPKGEPNANIMAYTVNNLSNRFLLKQTGSLFKSLLLTAMKSHETYSKELLKGSDKDIAIYLNNLRIRLDSLIFNIAHLYYDNSEKGNYLNTEKDNFDEDEFNIADNTSFLVSRIADAVCLRIASRGIDVQLANKVANMNEVSVSAIRNAINSLIENKREEIRELVISIMQLFLMDDKNKETDIRNLNFIIFCMKVYGKSNTKDESVLKIKDLLDEWLNETSEQYKRTERQATLSLYRKAVFMYFVFLISECAK